MGEVIEFKRPEDPNWHADFVLHVKLADKGYEIKVSEVRSDWPEDVRTFRTIARTLAPIAQGLIATAEDADPTARGKLLGQVLLYEDGTADLHIVPFKTVVEQAWVVAAFRRVLNHIKAAQPKEVVPQA